MIFRLLAGPEPGYFIAAGSGSPIKPYPRLVYVGPDLRRRRRSGVRRRCGAMAPGLELHFAAGTAVVAEVDQGRLRFASSSGLTLLGSGHRPSGEVTLDLASGGVFNFAADLLPGPEATIDLRTADGPLRFPVFDVPAGAVSVRLDPLDVVPMVMPIGLWPRQRIDPATDLITGDGGYCDGMADRLWRIAGEAPAESRWLLDVKIFSADGQATAPPLLHISRLAIPLQLVLRSR